MFHRIKSLAQHTAIYGLGDLLGRAVSVLLVPIYARHLTASDNGVVSLIWAFIGFSAVFYSLGLNPALVRVLSGKPDPQQNRKAFSSAFWTLLLIGCLFSTLLLASANILAVHLLGDVKLVSIFYLIAAIILLDALSEPLFTLCRSQQKSTVYATVRVCQHTLQLGLTVYFIAYRNQGVIAIFEANLISSILAFFAILPFGLSHLRPAFDTGVLRELLRFGLPFVPSSLAILIINLSDRFLIRFFLGLDELGIYGITYKLGLPIFFVVKAFRAAWAPAILSETQTGETRQICARVTTYFTLIGVFGCLILATFAPELITLVAGANAHIYLKGAYVAPLVALAFFCYGLYIILTAGVYIEGRATALPFIVGIGALTNITLNIVLLPRFGFIAAACSTLVAYGLMVLLLFVNVRRFYPVPYEYTRLGKIIATGIVVFIALSAYLHDATVDGIIARAIFLLSYPLILWGWQFFDPSEWRSLRQLF